MSAFSPCQLAILRRILGDSLIIERNRIEFDGRSVPISEGIIRFREEDDYNTSFALQWKTFQLNQYDRVNRTTRRKDRYRRETGWPTIGLDGELILEPGCGAGAFTCQLVATGANLVSFDYSSAVEVAAEHNANDRAVFAQADILDMPFAEGVFDRVFCHGVLQHTPLPEQAFYCLNRCLKPGGHMSLDIYRKDGKIQPWKAKYIWRPITTKMDPEKLMRLIQWYIPKWLPFDTFIKRMPIVGKYLGSLIPCFSYFWTDFSKEQQLQRAVLSTFDALAATYDLPVRMEQVEGWFRNCGYTNFEVRAGGNGIVGNGVKPR